jgi:hypothetical protein
MATRKKANSKTGKRTLHDRLFKEFLRRFLPEFMQLFFPTQAARLDFSTIRFFDKELIINLPEQELRITDVVAEVKTWQGETETILIHVEVEGRDKRTLPRRMSEYYVLLRLLFQKPVLPIALVLLAKADGLTWKEYTEELFGEKLLQFRYGRVAVRDLSAGAYLARQEPVAAALAVLMKTQRRSRAAVKLTALQTITKSSLSTGDKLFLITLVNTYAPTALLSDPREEIMRSLLDVEVVWGDDLIEKGREEGKILGECKMLLRVMTLIFGPLPAELVQQIEAITDEAILEDLTKQVFKAQSLNDLVILPPHRQKTITLE